MEKISLKERLKFLSKPQGTIEWGSAFRTIIIVIIAAVLANLLGYGEGLKIIIFVTLLAAIVIDVPLPLNNLIKLEITCAVMMSLAFITVGLTANSIPLFIIFTVLWSFFTLSMNIFGYTYGSLGFLLFSSYFVAVVTVEPGANPMDLGFYIIFAYLVASILLIPKIIFNKRNIRRMVAQGFKKETRFQDIIKTRMILSGIKINSHLHQLFNQGVYVTALRGYSYMALNHIPPNSQKVFMSFLQSAENISDNIAHEITELKTSKNVTKSLKDLDEKIKCIDESSTSKKDLKAMSNISKLFKSILWKSQNILNHPPSKEKVKFLSSRTSLKETLNSNFNLNNMYIRHTLRFTMAMIIGLIVVNLTHSRDAIWVAMGILIIMKPDISSTTDNFILRVFFNFLGVVVALILGSIFPQHIFIWISLLMLFLFRAFYPNNMGPSVMALTIFVVLIWPTGTVLDNATARLLDLTLGGIIAFIMGYLILPNRITFNIPEQTAKTVNVVSDCVKTVFVSDEMEYDSEKVLSKLKGFLLEYNNLEASIKKLKDSYKNVEEDVDFYENLSSSLYNLLSDISILASQMEIKKAYPDISKEGEHISDELNKLANIIKKNTSPENENLQIREFEMKQYNADIDQHIEWVNLDLNYIQNEVSNAYSKGVFNRYHDLR